MKLKTLALAAILTGAAFVGTSASAQTANHTSSLVIWDDGAGGYNGHFGGAFGASALGTNFSDIFTFNVGTKFDSASSLTSSFLSSALTKDLQITGFSLYRYDPTSMSILGTAIAGVNNTGPGAHPLDAWSLSAAGLAGGSYALKVDGKVLGNGGGAYAGDLTISPVPEPETYGMLLGGLGLLGFLARRRRKAA